MTETIAVVRIRGGVHLKPAIKKTLDLLGLKKNNSMVLVSSRPESKGMVSKVQAFIAFGEIDAKTLATVLKKRGKKSRVILNDAIRSKEKKAEEDLAAIASQITEGKRPQEFGFENLFRLKAPKKGFERNGIKRSFSVGGATGNRGREINALIMKMV